MYCPMDGVEHHTFLNIKRSPPHGKQTAARIEAAFVIASRQLRRIQSCVADPRYCLLRSIVGGAHVRRLHRTCIVYMAIYLAMLSAMWVKVYHVDMEGTYVFKGETLMIIGALVVIIAVKHFIQYPLGLGTIPLIFRSMASFYVSLSLIGTLAIFSFVSSARNETQNIVFDFMALSLSLFAMLTNTLRWEFHKYARCCEWILERDYGIERVMLSDIIAINRSIIHKINMSEKLIPPPFGKCFLDRVRFGFLKTIILDVPNHMTSVNFHKPGNVGISKSLLKRKESILRTYALHAGGSATDLLTADDYKIDGDFV